MKTPPVLGPEVRRSGNSSAVAILVYKIILHFPFFHLHSPRHPPPTHSLMCDRIWLVLSFVPNRTWFPRGSLCSLGPSWKKKFFFFFPWVSYLGWNVERGCLAPTGKICSFEPELYWARCLLVFITPFLLHQCVLNANTIPYIQRFASWAYYISNTCTVHYCAVRKDSQGCGASLGGWLSERVKAGAFLCRESGVNSDLAVGFWQGDRGLPVRFLWCCLCMSEWRKWTWGGIKVSSNCLDQRGSPIKFDLGGRSSLRRAWSIRLICGF